MQTPGMSLKGRRETYCYWCVSRQENKRTYRDVKGFIMVNCMFSWRVSLVKRKRSLEAGTQHTTIQDWGTLFSNSYRCSWDVGNSHRISYMDFHDTYKDIIKATCKCVCVFDYSISSQVKIISLKKKRSSGVLQWNRKGMDFLLLRSEFWKILTADFRCCSSDSAVGDAVVGEAWLPIGRHWTNLLVRSARWEHQRWSSVAFAAITWNERH